MAQRIRIHLFRSFIGDLHLWLGVASAIIVFLVCASGTILVFQEEFESFASTNSTRVEARGRSPIPLDALRRSIEESTGQDVKDLIISSPGHTYVAQLVPRDAAPGSRGVPRHVDPYTGMVGAREEGESGEGFFATVERLHRWLLLDSAVGRPLVGVATLIFVVLALTGFVLWLPRRLREWQAWRRGLAIETRKGWRRLNYDLHNTLGLYALPLLLVMGLSGLIWSFPWYWKGMEFVLNDTLGKARFDAPIPMNYSGSREATVPVERLLTDADRLLPYPAMAYRVTFPQTADHSILVRKKPAGFFRIDAADKIQFNPYTGEALLVERFTDQPLRSQIASLIRSIHVGSVFGSASKLAYFAASLIATSLPLTGVWIWLDRLLRKRKVRLRK
ncbi:MAG: PepSY domain-containing protein [Candidatus Hydrogenedentes bacterium]|nr:PepSY domain-containing protein [Candidatus Hydrogenedentota bacterium]